ncbi:hypothetical protein BGZ63DRAFT_414968 [Mariannaea sp. PMI_226]|nr:hypothetical protein BGZ63DRAFT_414968 [Mariannaea sp. PMI_226]
MPQRSRCHESTCAPPVSRTFTLIPQHPGRNDSSEVARPMTSKQAREAYKAASRGPRLSRIERIKQERAEKERIRKEFEKEKASAKAKAARERKKGKELAEREEKRKRGLPLVTVRPSQDTISRFICGNGITRKRDAQGEQVKAKEVEEQVTDQPHSNSLSKLDDIMEDEDEGEEEEEEKKAKDEEEDVDHAQDLKTGPFCPTPAVEMQNTNNEANDSKEGGEEEADGSPEDLFTSFSSPAVQPEKLAAEKDLIDDDVDLDDLDDDFEEDLALEMLEVVEASVKRAAIKNAQDIAQDNDQQPRQDFKPGITRYEQDLGLSKHAAMAPPPRPSAIKPVPDHPSSSISPPRQAPPLSTQAILFNFDDFFPSASQQARELEEDFSEDERPAAPPPPMQPAKELDTPEPSLPQPRAESPSPPPRRFFTSSGSHELMSLALQRSRRSAELEKVQQRDRMRIQPSVVEPPPRKVVKEEPRPKLTTTGPHINTPKPGPKPIVKAQTLSNKPVNRQQMSEHPAKLGHLVDKSKMRAAPSPLPTTHAKVMPGMPKMAHANSTMRPIIKQSEGNLALSHSNIPPAQIPPTAKKGTTENKENIRPITLMLSLNNQNQEPPSASQETDYGGGDWIDEIASELMI